MVAYVGWGTPFMFWGVHGATYDKLEFDSVLSVPTFSLLQYVSGLDAVKGNEIKLNN